MRLLFDANLPPRLVETLRNLFPGSRHVRDAGMARASDDAIWELARDGGFTIVSKDGDFQQRSFVHGPPPKVVWLKVGNCSTQDVERVIRSRHAEILRFLEAQDAALLVLS